MTAPTTETEPSGPIDDALLAEALTARANASDMDFGEPEATPAPDAGTVTEGTPTADKPEDAPAPDATPDGPAAKEGDEAATAPAPDPFAEMMKLGTPLTYTVDRQSKTFDGILEVPGKGALIPADKLADVRDRLAREESNAAFTKELYAERQRYEQDFGGYEGIAQKLESAAQVNAAALHIMDVLQKSRDAQGNIQLDAYNYGLLVKEAGIKAKEAQWEYRAERETQQRTQAETQSEAQVAESVIPTALQALKAKYPTLTDEDWAEFAETYSPIRDNLRFKATPEQAQQYGVKPGAWLIDMPKMEPFAAKRAAFRAAQTTAATAQSAAAKFNATVAPKATAKPKPKPVPRDEDGKFVERPRVNPSDAFERALSGRSITGRDFDE